MSFWSMLECQNFISKVYIIFIDQVLKNSERMKTSLENYGMILTWASEKNVKVIAFFPDPVISINNEPSLKGETLNYKMVAMDDF